MFEGVVATILNRFLGNYVANLETTQLKLGIWQGDVKLEKLRLKSDALDKLRLPVDIKEGWLGTLTISIPWSNLKGEPVRIHIDNVYVLATPRFQENFDPEREDEREFKRKMHRLENDELLRQQQLLKKQGAEVAGDEKKQASFTEQLVTKIVDNLQIVIENIHVRYEDHISNPDRMFAVGATLSELSAVSTDEEWHETFVHDSGNVIHKLLKLAQFSVYWDTDCESMQGRSHDDLAFSHSEKHHGQQSILQPVVGLGRLTMNKRPTPEDIRTMLKFEFDQLAFELDDKQYEDALLLTAAFDYAMRQRRYRKHRPPPGVRPKDDPRAWLLFAIRSVYDEVHQHNYRKTWEYRRQRREERQLYIRLYTAFKVNNGTLAEVDAKALDALHHSLSYEDIRHYRALSEPAIRKQQYLIRKRDAEVNQAKTGNTGSADNAAAGGGAGITGWVGGWISSWVSSSAQPQDQQGSNMGDVSPVADDEDSTQLSEKQVQELYDAIEFNEEEADLFDDDDNLPKETIKLAATAILRSGSLKLKVDRKTRDHTLMGFMFNFLKLDLLQRPQNLVADISMHRFEVVDGTLPNTQYPRMIYVHSDEDESSEADKEEQVFMAVADAPDGLAAQISKDSSSSEQWLDIGRKLKDPFLQVHFEQNPLDGHADSVVNVKVKSLNVIYHPTAVKAIINYFEPPSTASAESIHALIAAASKSMAGFREQTRAGLEYALAKHKTADIKVDFDAPVFVIPQNMLDPHSQVVVLDTGYLTIESQLVDGATSERVHHSHKTSPKEMQELESLMYDHFDMRLHSTQLLVGNDLATCIRTLRNGEADQTVHVVDRIELNFDLGLCILSDPPLHMPKVTIDGSLPSLQVYFSDRKYKAIMSSIDLILEAIEDENVDITQQYEITQVSTAFGAGGLLSSSSNSSSLALNSLTDNASDSADSDIESHANDSRAGTEAYDSGDEFFESTDQMDEEQATSTSAATAGPAKSAAGKLQRKANPSTRVNVGKEPERVTVRVNFAVDNLVGFVWRTHTDGRDDLHIGDIAVTGLAVECINRPFDLFADVTIHQVTVEDHLMTTTSKSPNSESEQQQQQKVYALTSDIAQADANGETGKNLVVVKYHRCQADHPEFTTTYESIGQTVEVDISYLDLMVVRKTILTTYDYILKTFTDEGGLQRPASRRSSNARDKQSPATNLGDEQASDNVSSLIKEALDTIRVDVRFKGTDFSLCHDDGTPIALLSVTAATMQVLLTQQIQVEAKIGNIKLADQLDLLAEDGQGSLALQDPRRLLMYIKGDDLADFRFETFDPSSSSYPGHHAAIKLRLGAAHLMFVERPIRELMLFGSRFSAMHGLFEAARQAAAYGTTQLTEEMMGNGQKYHFDIVMLAPIITFPRDGVVPYSSSTRDHLGVDVLEAQLGELTVSNEFTTVREKDQDWDINHISLALRRIGLKSMFVISEDSSEHGSFGQPGKQMLQMLEDVNYRMDMHVLMHGHIVGCPRPVTELVGMLSPVKMKLTEYQYKMTYDILMMIARVFGNDPNWPIAPDPLINDRMLDLEILRENPATRGASNTRQALANLRQIDDTATESLSEEQRTGQYASVDLFVTLSTIQLELFQGSGFDLSSIRKASFTRMDINDLSVKYRAKANGDSKAEVAIVAVRAYDTRPETQNQFTQIISPTIHQKTRAEGSGTGTSAAADPDNSHGSMHAMAQDTPIEEDCASPQLICHVDMRPNQDMVVLVTFDSPRVILVLDHVFMLMGFAASAFPEQQQQPQPTMAEQYQQSSQSPGSVSSPKITDNTTGGLIYKVDILHPEIILLADPSKRSSEALVLSVNQMILAQEGLFCATMDEIGVSLCTISQRQETARSVMDPFTVIATMDSRSTAEGQISDVSVDVGSLLLRLGMNDVLLMLEIFNTAMALMYRDAGNAENEQHAGNSESPRVGSAQPPHTSGWDEPVGSSGASTASAPTTLRAGGNQQSGSPVAEDGPIGRVVKETMRITVAMLRVVVIRDMFGLPVYACTAREFHIDAADWSVGLRLRSDVQLQASYFNRRNSHWEPAIEPWRFSVRAGISEGVQRVDVRATDRLLLNASHALIEETLSVAAQWGAEVAQRGGERMPYVLVNRTGVDCHVWVDQAEGVAARIDTSPVLLRDGESLPWRFEDWRRRREQLEATAHHVGIQFSNGQWEWLRRVQVDREGVRHYTLRPALDGISHRVAVEVRLDAVNMVKRVELRSPLVVANRTRISMEVAMCDYRGELRTDSAVVEPGEELPLPILFCHQYAIRVRPSGFGYAWSNKYIYWRDFLAPDARTELCCLPGAERGATDEMPFFVHFNALCDARNPALYKYPFMRLVMTPPLEIENLLPYSMQLCVIDKTAGRKWISSLDRGAVAAVHAVQPAHLVLLTIRIPDAGFERCDGSIIETSDDDEYPVDDTITVIDRHDISLALRLHRMDVSGSGGRCRRISIYAPYVMVNRSGLKLFYSSKGFFKGVSAVAGQNLQQNAPRNADDVAPSREANEDAQPLMFSFGSYDLKNRALVRVAGSEWSRPLSFDALGSAAEVVVPASNKLADTHLGIQIEPGRGRYSHTRVVTFTSRYVIKNTTGLALQYRSVYNSESASIIRDGERQPMHTLLRARRRLLTIACAASDVNGRLKADIQGARWSAPFSMDDVGRGYVRMPTSASEEVLVKIDVVLEGACLFVILQREDRHWPYVIENLTSIDITVWQIAESKHGESSQAAAAGGYAAAGQGSPVRKTATLPASSAATAERKYTIKAGETLNYAWDVPTAANKLLVVSAQGATRKVSLQEIGEQRPFVYGRPPHPPATPAGRRSAALAQQRAIAECTMNIEVVAAGPRQVLRLTGYTPEHSLYVPPVAGSGGIAGPRVSRTSTTQTSATQRTARSNSEDRFEVVEDERTNYIFRLALEGGVGVSVINRYSSEILFATLADVELKCTDSTSNQTFRLSVKWIQIDNQIYGALFPIVLYPTMLGAVTAGVSSPPALQAVVVRSKDRSYGVEYFKYASVLAQEMSIELDEDFLYALLDFVKFNIPGRDVNLDNDTLTMLSSAIPEVKAQDEGVQLYFEFLHIQPFKINISFMRTQRLDVGGDPTTARYPQVALNARNDANTGMVASYTPEHGLAAVAEHTGEGVASTPGVVAYAMNVLTMAIGNINEAPVSLNALIMQNVRVSMPVLTDRMQKHYSQEVFNQVYKVVGSANFLGNPVGLFNSISSGVSDFFYEPYQGFVMSDRPQDFGFGLARGTASLFKKTVFGMTDSFSKFTDSVSKGLSAATLDPRFQTERSMSRVRNKPKHAIYGVARGAESLAKSVTSGIAGVVMRPLEGAEQEGVGGFFKGVGKGLVGVVTKPVVGMFDLASNVTEGIRNTTTVFERDLDRQRLPRHINRSGIITAYSAREALGQAWMRELNKGAYALDNYLAHLELPHSDMIVLLTYQRLIMFRRSKPDEAGMTVGAAGSSTETGTATGAVGISSATNAAKAHVEWEQEIKSLHSIQLETTGISLKLPATPEGYVPPGPFIPIADAQSRRWFYDRIKEAVKALVDDRKDLG